MKYLKYFENSSFIIEESKNFEDVIKFILEDDNLYDEYKTSAIDALKTLSEKYKEKVYASRIVYFKDIRAGEEPANAGDKKLVNIGISEVGKYWDYSDLPYLINHFKKYNFEIDYIHEYRYITLINNDRLVKYWKKEVDKYNL